MRAVMWEGAVNSVSIRSIPKPTLQLPEDAIIRITSSAICGSDLHTYRGTLGSDPAPPWSMGHEAVGVVAEVGPATEHFKVGDRVLIPCLDGLDHFAVEPTLNLPLNLYGSGRGFGGDLGGCQAEYLRVESADDSLVRIPDDFSSDLQWLFLTDIFTTGWAGLDFAGFQPGESVAVFGCGPVGLMCIYSAKLRGASHIYAVDCVRARLDKAVEIGGGLVTAVDFTSREEGSASEQILRRRPAGVHRVVDCVGAEAVNDRLKPDQSYVINETIKVCTFGGGIGQIGVYAAIPTTKGAPRGGEIDPIYGVDMSSVWLKSLSIKAGIVPMYELLPRLYELVRTGAARLDWVVSAQVGIEDVPAAYDRFNRHLETKVVIRFPQAGRRLMEQMVGVQGGTDGVVGVMNGNGQVKGVAIDKSGEENGDLAAQVIKPMKDLQM